MPSIRKRLRWSRKGVSEIIGNILILGITVTLFSSIMYFVASMPAPQESAYADLSTSPRWFDGTSLHINITHNGGQELKNSTTLMVFYLNGVQFIRYISNSSPSIGDKWVTGLTWRGTLPVAIGANPFGTLTVQVIDTQKNTMVWTGTVSGGATGENVKPIIGARGTSPTPSYIGDPIYFYATVTDPDGDLNTNSVYIDLRTLGLGQEKMTSSTGNTVFTFGPTTAVADWGGKTVVINATDLSGHASSGLLTINLQVKPGNGNNNNQYGPYINYSSYLVNGTYPPDASGGESGGAGGFVGTTFYYIRKADDYGTITRNFAPGEKIIIEVYSDALDNVGLENTFTMTQPLTGDPIVPPSSSAAFGYGGIFGTFHRYNYTFAAPANRLEYPIQIQLKDTTGGIINIVDSIKVNGASYPSIQVYRGNLTTGAFENTRGNFSLTDTIYVRVITQDVDANMANVVVGNIEVSDFSGRYIINTPPSSFTAYPNAPGYSAPPVSSIFKTTLVSINRVGDGTTGAGVAYTFYLNPKDAYQGWWLPRNNAYTLRISMISDQGTPLGEIYYDITAQINITAPLTTTDIIASIGSGSYTWSSSGGSWSNNKLAWFSSTERSDQWNRVTIEDPTYSGPLGLAMADIDNDGYDDLIVGYQDPNVNVAWFRNPTDGTANWNGPYIIASPGFDALAGTQNYDAGSSGGGVPRGATPSDGAPNGNRNEDSTLYIDDRATAPGYQSKTYGYVANYGGTTYALNNEICGAMAIGDFDGDGQMDVAVSYVHTIIWSDAYSEAQGSDPAHSHPMFFNRGIYVYWGSTWQRTQLYGTDGWVSSNTSNSNSNPAALDLATGDLNQDGYDDIVAVYENGQTQVWFSLASQVAGNRAKIFGPGSNMMVQATVAGTNPWDHTGKMPQVRVANIDSNGYPDIIRTSTASNTVAVFYTQPQTSGGVTWIPSIGYSSGPGVTGSVTGALANLTSVDTSWQNLSEVNKVYPVDVEKPTTKSAEDTTGQNVANLREDDGQTYNVDPYTEMYISAFDYNASYASKQIASATLIVKYTADSGYVGTSPIEVSIADGIPGSWFSTGIVPQSTDVDRVATYNLGLTGATLQSQLASLDVRFYGGSAGTIRISYMWVDVQYIQNRTLDWTYEIPNSVTQPLHQLTIDYKCVGTESYTLQYSPDNTTWLYLGVLSGTSEQTLKFSLAHTTNSKYFIKIHDNDPSPTDPTLDKVCLNQLVIRHYSPTVAWSNVAGESGKIEKTLSPTDLPSTEWITSIAIGDVGSTYGDHLPDGFPDIVVGTTKTDAGANGARYTVFIWAQQSGGGGFSLQNVYTPTIASQVSNSIYDTSKVELGDIDGDYDLDIVVVMGYAAGMDEGSAPTLWLVENDPLPLAWQFIDRPINALTGTEGVINVITGNVDLTILLPLLGVLGVVAAEAVVSRKKDH